MKTASNVLSLRCRWIVPAVSALLLAGLAPRMVIAIDPPSEAPATTTVQADPYLYFLDSLVTRDANCQAQSHALRSLLTSRERLLRQFLQAPAAGRTDLGAAIATLDQKIDAAEAQLGASVARTQPGDGPYFVPPPVVDIEAIRQQSKRWRKPMYLPMPPPLVIPPLPAPAGEALYLEYLTVRAGTSKFAQDLVADVRHLLQERRALAYRHAHGQAHERARLEDTIRTVSLQVRNSAQTAAEGPVVTNW